MFEKHGRRSEKIVGLEGVRGWNPYPGRGRRLARGRILAKAII